jgi:uncharacterized protein (TIGR03083 family)
MAVMLDVMYRSARQRFVEAISALDGEQLQTPVPATPGWTLHELLAHLVGIAADISCGRLDGAPGDEWTARHVKERRHRSVGELVTEWELVGPTVESSLVRARVDAPNLAADIVVHEGDMREALGFPRADREHWQALLEVMMGLLGRRLRRSTALVIRDEHGQEWRCGSGGPVTLLRADGYELLRGTFSRRSQRQIAEWDWTPAPRAPMIERFGAFGPRDDDQPVPPA